MDSTRSCINDRSQAGFFSVEMVVATAVAATLAGVAFLAIAGAVERSRSQQLAAWVGQQVLDFSLRSQADGRDGAIRSGNLLLPSGQSAIEAPACAFDPGDSEYEPDISPFVPIVRLCAFCIGTGGVPVDAASATCVTGGGLPDRCQTRGLMRGRLAGSPTATEQMQGWWLPATDISHATEIQHYIDEAVRSASLPGLADNANALTAGTYQVGTIKPRVLISRFERVDGTAGVLICL